MSSFSSTLGGNKASKHSPFSYAMLILALSSMVFLGVCNPETFRQGISGTAATVGNQEISNREFAWAYQNVSERLRSQYGEQFNAGVLKVAHLAMNQLVDDRILFLESQKYAFVATDDEVMKAIAEFKEFKDEKTGKFSKERFEKYLQAAQLSESTMLEDQRRAMSVARLRQFIVTSSFVSSKEVELDQKVNQARANLELLTFDSSKIKVEVTPKEISDYLAAPDAESKVKAWYESHISDYKSEEKVKARHILVAYKDARNATPTVARSKEEAAALAKKLLADVKANGADFGAIAKKESDEPSAKRTQGDLGFFVKSDMVEEFSKAAFAMKVGEISDVVESPFGFHIIKVEERKPALDISLADAQNDIVKKMLLEVKGPSEMEAKAKAVLDAVLQKQDTGALLAELGVAWQSIEDFSPTGRSIPKVGAKQVLIDAILSLDMKEKPIYPDLIKNGPNIYIVKLVSVNEGDKKSLDEKSLRRLAYSASFSQGYSDFSAFQQRAKREYEARNEIYLNPQYLAVDEAQEGQES